MRFSVVVPTCDRPEALAQCLGRLAPGSQSVDIADYEVIVTDDGTRPVETMVRREFPWAQWTAGPRRGPAANRNHGAAVAQGEWLAFTDDDCLPDRAWIATFLAMSGGTMARVLEGRVYVDRPRGSCFETSPINDKGGNLWSCNFAIVRAAFVSHGGFDERFRHAAMEDMEFKVRLQKGGERIEFCPEATVLHPWVVLRDLRRHQANHLESVLLFNALHPDRAVRWKAQARFMLRRYTRELWRDVRQFGGEALRYYGQIIGPDLERLRRLRRQEKAARL